MRRNFAGVSTRSSRHMTCSWLRPPPARRPRDLPRPAIPFSAGCGAFSACPRSRCRVSPGRLECPSEYSFSRERDRTKPCFHMRFGPSSCCLRRSGGRLLVWRCLMLNTQSEASVSAQGMTERHERFGSDDYVVFKNVQKTYDGEHLIVKDLN